MGFLFILCYFITQESDKRKTTYTIDYPNKFYVAKSYRLSDSTLEFITDRLDTIKIINPTNVTITKNFK